MAWSGGTFTGLHFWTNDRDSNIKITASRHEAQDDVFIAGINSSVNKDGSNAFTAAADFGGYGLSEAGTITPKTASASDIGSAALEFGDVYIGDDKDVYYGNDQDYTFGYNTTLAAMTMASAVEGVGFNLVWQADQGDDAKDQWKWEIDVTSGVLLLRNDASSADSFITHITFTPHATVASSAVAFAGGITVAGTMAVTGDATFTGDILSNASGSTTIGSASAEFAGAYFTDNADIFFGADQDYTFDYDTARTAMKLESNVEAAPFNFVWTADQNDDAGDSWRWNIANDGGVMTLLNDIETADTFVIHVTFTPHATVASSTVAFAGQVTGVGFTGTLDGILGGGTPAAMTGTTLTATGAVALNGGAFTFNSSTADLDAIFGSNNNANTLIVNGEHSAVGVGAQPQNGTTVEFTLGATTRSGVTSVGAFNLVADTININNGATTLANMSAMAIGVQTFAGANAVTFTNTASLYIAGIPVASTNITFTNAAYSLWVDAGTSRFDGTISSGTSSGPAIICDEDATATNPTLCPDMSNEAYGVGAVVSGGELHLIVNGASIGAFHSSGLALVGTEGLRLTSNTNAPAILGEEASSSNPVLCPSRADLDSGIGWVGTNEIALITGGGLRVSIHSGGLGVTGNGAECIRAIGGPFVATNLGDQTVGADTVHFYSHDLSSGNTVPAFNVEGSGGVATETVTADTTLIIRYDGANYKLDALAL
jgi:hypothetical protein